MAKVRENRSEVKGSAPIQKKTASAAHTRCLLKPSHRCRGRRGVVVHVGRPKVEGYESEREAKAGDDQRGARQNQGLMEIVTSLHASPQLSELHAADLSVEERLAEEQEGCGRHCEDQVLDPGSNSHASIPMVSSQGILRDAEPLQPEGKRNEVESNHYHHRDGTPGNEYQSRRASRSLPSCVPYET